MAKCTCCKGEPNDTCDGCRFSEDNKKDSGELVCVLDPGRPRSVKIGTPACKNFEAIPPFVVAVGILEPSPDEKPPDEFCHPEDRCDACGAPTHVKRDGLCQDCITIREANQMPFEGCPCFGCLQVSEHGLCDGGCGESSEKTSHKFKCDECPENGKCD